MGTSHFPAAAPSPSPCFASPQPQTHFPAPTSCPLGMLCGALGQFAYILIYKKLSAPADSDDWAAF